MTNTIANRYRCVSVACAFFLPSYFPPVTEDRDLWQAPQKHVFASMATVAQTLAHLDGQTMRVFRRSCTDTPEFTAGRRSETGLCHLYEPQRQVSF